MSGDLWSLEALQILALFQGGAKLHGYAVHQITGVGRPTVHAILDRFERRGILASETEHVDPQLSRRMPKVVYQGTTIADDQILAIRALVSA